MAEDLPQELPLLRSASFSPTSLASTGSVDDAVVGIEDEAISQLVSLTSHLRALLSPCTEHTIELRSALGGLADDLTVLQRARSQRGGPAMCAPRVMVSGPDGESRSALVQFLLNSNDVVADQSTAQNTDTSFTEAPLSSISGLNSNNNNNNGPTSSAYYNRGIWSAGLGKGISASPMGSPKFAAPNRDTRHLLLQMLVDGELLHTPLLSAAPGDTQGQTTNFVDTPPPQQHQPSQPKRPSNGRQLLQSRSSPNKRLDSGLGNYSANTSSQHYPLPPPRGPHSQRATAATGGKPLGGGGGCTPPADAHFNSYRMPSVYVRTAAPANGARTGVMSKDSSTTGRALEPPLLLPPIKTTTPPPVGGGTSPTQQRPHPLSRTIAGSAQTYSGQTARQSAPELADKEEVDMLRMRGDAGTPPPGGSQRRNSTSPPLLLHRGQSGTLGVPALEDGSGRTSGGPVRFSRPTSFRQVTVSSPADLERALTPSGSPNLSSVSTAGGGGVLPEIGVSTTRPRRRSVSAFEITIADLVRNSDAVRMHFPLIPPSPLSSSLPAPTATCNVTAGTDQLKYGSATLTGSLGPFPPQQVAKPHGGDSGTDAGVQESTSTVPSTRAASTTGTNPIGCSASRRTPLKGLNSSPTSFTTSFADAISGAAAAPAAKLSWVLQESRNCVVYTSRSTRPQVPISLLSDVVIFALPCTDVGRPALEESLSLIFGAFMSQEPSQAAPSTPAFIAAPDELAMSSISLGAGAGATMTNGISTARCSLVEDGDSSPNIGGSPAEFSALPGARGTPAFLPELRRVMAGQVVFVLTGIEMIYRDSEPGSYAGSPCLSASTCSSPVVQLPPVCHSIKSLVSRFHAQVLELYGVSLKPWQILPFSTSACAVTRDYLHALYAHVTAQQSSTGTPAPAGDGGIGVASASRGGHVTPNLSSHGSLVVTSSQTPPGRKHSILRKRRTDGTEMEEVIVPPVMLQPPLPPPNQYHQPQQQQQQQGCGRACNRLSLSVPSFSPIPLCANHSGYAENSSPIWATSPPMTGMGLQASPRGGGGATLAAAATNETMDYTTDATMTLTTASATIAADVPSSLPSFARCGTQSSCQGGSLSLTAATDRYCAEMYGPRFMESRHSKFTEADLTRLVLYNALGDTWYTSGAHQFAILCNHFEINSLLFIVSEAALSLLTWCAQLLPLLPEAGQHSRAKAAKCSRRLAATEKKLEQIGAGIHAHKTIASPHVSALAMHNAMHETFTSLVEIFLRDLRVMVVLRSEPRELDVAFSSSLAAAYTRLRDTIEQFYSLYVDSRLEQTLTLLKAHISAVHTEHAQRLRRYCEAQPDLAAFIGLYTSNGSEEEGGGCSTASSLWCGLDATSGSGSGKCMSGSGSGAKASSGSPSMQCAAPTAAFTTMLEDTEARRGARARASNAADPTFHRRLARLLEQRGALERRLVVAISQLNTEIINFFIAFVVASFPLLKETIATQVARWQERCEELLGGIAETRPPTEQVPFAYLRHLLHSTGDLHLLSVHSGQSFRNFVTSLRAALCEDQVRGMARLRQHAEESRNTSAAAPAAVAVDKAEGSAAGSDMDLDAFVFTPFGRCSSHMRGGAGGGEGNTVLLTMEEVFPPPSSGNVVATHQVAQRACTYIRKWQQRRGEGSAFVTAVMPGVDPEELAEEDAYHSPTIVSALSGDALGVTAAGGEGSLASDSEKGKPSSPVSGVGGITAASHPFLASDVPPDLMPSDLATHHTSVRRETARFAEPLRRHLSSSRSSSQYQPQQQRRGHRYATNSTVSQTTSSTNNSTHRRHAGANSSSGRIESASCNHASKKEDESYASPLSCASAAKGGDVSGSSFTSGGNTAVKWIPGTAPPPSMPTTPWQFRLAAWRADVAPEVRPHDPTQHSALWVLLDTWDEVLLSTPYSAWMNFDYGTYASILNEVGLQLLVAQQSWLSRLNASCKDHAEHVEELEAEAERLLLPAYVDTSVAHAVENIFEAARAVATRLDEARDAALAPTMDRVLAARASASRH